MDSIPHSPPPKARILTVCSGNLCRSPYLERRLTYELRSAWGPSDIAVSSAGTQAVVGSDMAPLARSMLWRSQPDSEPFQARALTPDLVREASLVITATRQHRTLVARMDPRSMKKTHALRDLANLADHIVFPSPAVSTSGPGESVTADGTWGSFAADGTSGAVTADGTWGAVTAEGAGGSVTAEGAGGSVTREGAGGSVLREGAGQSLTAAEWLEMLVPQLAGLRGTIPTLPEERANIVDPIGRSEAVFEEMREQIESALVPVLRLLKGPR